jgi:hypothetical protein
MALGIALSPVPATAVIIILMSSRARTNAPAFLLGWTGGILMVGIITFIVPGIDTVRGEPTVFSGWLMIVMGAALLFLSVRQWALRPPPNETVTVPRFLARLERTSMARSIITGLMLSSVTPKNLLLTIAGAASIDASMLSPMAQMFALSVFALVASLGVGAPVLSIFLYQQRAESVLGNWKSWLIKHNVKVIIGAFLVFGLLLIARGKAILTGAAGA